MNFRNREYEQVDQLTDVMLDVDVNVKLWKYVETSWFGLRRDVTYFTRSEFYYDGVVHVHWYSNDVDEASQSAALTTMAETTEQLRDRISELKENTNS